MGALRGCVGARVTPVAAGVHSLILILTASMTYGLSFAPGPCVLFGIKNMFFLCHCLLSPFITVSVISIVRLLKQWNLKLSRRSFIFRFMGSLKY